MSKERGYLGSTEDGGIDDADRDISHYEGCWKDHPECAQARLERAPKAHAILAEWEGVYLDQGGALTMEQRDKAFVQMSELAVDLEGDQTERFRPLVYLASPYTHPDEEVQRYRFEAVSKAAAVLMSQGLHIYSPISHTRPIAIAGGLPHGWDFWEPYDRAILSCCHRVVVLRLDGWQESKGVTAELKLAREMKLLVEFMNPTTLEIERV